MRHWKFAVILLCSALVGCGTTKWSDTSRTATEQLLISDAIDQAVNRIDFRNLAEKPVYLETKYLQNVVDQSYLISSLRQHMLASGCILKEKAEDAALVVEARAGAVGTNRADLLFGVPAFNVPVAVPVTGMPTSIPEIGLVKKTQQQAVAKIAVFAIDKAGDIVWQSGTVPVTSKATDTWVMGAGPFQRGTIYDGTKFAGGGLPIPLLSEKAGAEGRPPLVPVQSEAIFINPKDIGAPEGASPPQTAAGPTPKTAAAPADAKPAAAGTPAPAVAPPATPAAAPPAALAAKPAETTAAATGPATTPPATAAAAPTGTPSPPAGATAGSAPPAPPAASGPGMPPAAATASTSTPAAATTPSAEAKPSPAGQPAVTTAESAPAVAKLPPLEAPAQATPAGAAAVAASGPEAPGTIFESSWSMLDAALRGDRGLEPAWDLYGDPSLRFAERPEEPATRR